MYDLDLSTDLKKQAYRFGDETAQAIAETVTQYLVDIRHAEEDLLTWEAALEQLYLSEAETQDVANLIAFPIHRTNLMPTAPEEFVYDPAQDDTNRPGHLDEPDFVEQLPENQFAGIRQSRHKIFDQKTKDGYYSLPADQRREVLRLHRSLAHLPAIDLARLLLDAGAREEVISWTKNTSSAPCVNLR